MDEGPANAAGPEWLARCIRNPIPNSRFIYDWVRLGMRIYVHH
jgi:hypothetical protein